MLGAPIMFNPFSLFCPVSLATFSKIKDLSTRILSYLEKRPKNKSRIIFEREKNEWRAGASFQLPVS
jgi:hypothetical protein